MTAGAMSLNHKRQTLKQADAEDAVEFRDTDNDHIRFVLADGAVQVSAPILSSGTVQV